MFNWELKLRGCCMCGCRSRGKRKRSMENIVLLMLLWDILFIVDSVEKEGFG